MVMGQSADPSLYSKAPMQPQIQWPALVAPQDFGAFNAAISTNGQQANQLKERVQNPDRQLPSIPQPLSVSASVFRQAS